jgi:hypothetical protein
MDVGVAPAVPSPDSRPRGRCGGGRRRSRRYHRSTSRPRPAWQRGAGAASGTDEPAVTARDATGVTAIRASAASRLLPALAAAFTLAGCALGRAIADVAARQTVRARVRIGLRARRTCALGGVARVGRACGRSRSAPAREHGVEQRCRCSRTHLDQRTGVVRVQLDSEKRLVARQTRLDARAGGGARPRRWACALDGRTAVVLGSAKLHDTRARARTGTDRRSRDLRSALAGVERVAGRVAPAARLTLRAASVFEAVFVGAAPPARFARQVALVVPLLEARRGVGNVVGALRVPRRTATQAGRACDAGGTHDVGRKENRAHVLRKVAQAGHDLTTLASIGKTPIRRRRGSVERVRPPSVIRSRSTSACTAARNDDDRESERRGDSS